MPIAHPQAGVGQEWLPVWGGREGVWPLSGTIEVPINNYPPPNPWKDIWVQVTWAKQTQQSQLFTWELNSGAQGQLVSQ